MIYSEKLLQLIFCKKWFVLKTINYFDIVMNNILISCKMLNYFMLNLYVNHLVVKNSGRGQLDGLSALVVLVGDVKGGLIEAPVAKYRMVIDSWKTFGSPLLFKSSKQSDSVNIFCKLCFLFLNKSFCLTSLV